MTTLVKQISFVMPILITVILIFLLAGLMILC